MTEKRLRPTKTISTKTISYLSEKVCEKIKDAAYANIVNAVKNDKAAAEQVVADSYYILHVQQEFGDYCKIISGEYKAEKGLYDICEELRPSAMQHPVSSAKRMCNLPMLFRNPRFTC